MSIVYIYIYIYKKAVHPSSRFRLFRLTERLAIGSMWLLALSKYYDDMRYLNDPRYPFSVITGLTKQRVLMHGHQGWNVRHSLCHIYMIYVYIWVVYSFCLFCCLFVIVTTQFVALYKPCKPEMCSETLYLWPPDNHPLAEIQRPILSPEPKQQICHQHANTDHLLPKYPLKFE